MSRVFLTYADAVHTYFSWRVEGSAEVRTARISPERNAALRDSFARSFPDAAPGETQEEALRRTFHDGAFRSPQDTWTYLSQLSRLLLPPELLRNFHPARRRQLLIRPSPGLAQVPWALLPTGRKDRMLGDVADVSLYAPDSVVALAPEPRPGAQPAEELMVIDPKIPGQPPSGPLGSVLGRPTPTDPLSALLRPTTVPRAATYPELARTTLGREEFLSLSGRARSLLFVGHVSAAGVESASAESSTLHLAEPVSAGDLLRAGWQAPARVGLLGCGSGSDLRYPEPFGLATTAVACGADTVVASLWTLPTEAALDALDAGVQPLRELILATDRALRAEDPVRSLLDWQLAKARAWYAEGRAADNPAWWAAPAVWRLDRQG